MSTQCNPKRFQFQGLGGREGTGEPEAEKKFGPVRRKKYQRMLSEHKLEVLRAVEASELPVLEVLGPKGDIDGT